VKARRLLVTLLGLVVSALGLLVAFWRVHLAPFSVEPRVHWPDLRAAFATARWPWLAAYAALNATTLVTRALQLQALARRKDGGRPGLGPSWRAVTVGMLAQTILPARLGEAARAVAIIKDGDVPAPVAVGALALGRVLDLVALLAVTCAPPLVLGLSAAAAGPVRTAASIGSLAALVLLVGLIWFYRRRKAAARAADGLRPWLGRLLGGLAEGLSALGSPVRLLVAALTSLAIPATVAACYAAAARGFDIALPSGGALVMVAAVFLAIAVPSAPSAVGVYHAVAGWVLGRFGAAPAAAAAFAITTHAIGVVEFIVLGGISFVQLGGKLRGDTLTRPAA
jgi:glycosyltransferase 2 family protein